MRSDGFQSLPFRGEVAGLDMIVMGPGIPQREANIARGLRLGRRLAVEHPHCTTLQSMDR